MKDISARDNPLVKKLRLLASSSRARREQGETLLDGAHLLAAALACDWPLQAVVVSASGAEQEEIAALLARSSANSPCYRLPDRLFAQLSPVDTPSGVLAVIELPAPPAAALDADLLVLEGVQDPGNLGSILRTAAAAGIGEVLLSPGCAGVWSPRVLRAGMGAHFVLRLHEDVDLLTALADYRGRILATALSARARSLYALELNTAPCAWLFGAEGQGLSAVLRARADEEVMIPLAAGTESLNVGAAVAVCLFEQGRQRAVAGQALASG